MPGQYRSDKSAELGSPADRPGFSAVDEGAPPGPDSVRLLRRDIGAAVAAVATTDERGFRGVTVSAFCIVSLNPARLLACVGAASESLAAIQLSGHFALSVLSDRQEFLADQLAGRAPAVNPRFNGIKHQLSKLGDPILEECLVWFSCAVQASNPQGDHTVVYGDIREAGYGSGREPLLYFDGSYRYFQVD
ncbi:MAG TPA: flavin reductase family protein [Chloroflexota bacterium]|nr:flavin reductase family protein [Chloroflexota bacterium]